MYMDLNNLRHNKVSVLFVTQYYMELKNIDYKSERKGGYRRNTLVCFVLYITDRYDLRK